MCLAVWEGAWSCVSSTVKYIADLLTGANFSSSTLTDADFVVVTLALTPETTGIVDATVLDAMPEHAWVINVARGRHIVTDHLVAALINGDIAGAALDVTEPEPLPDGHALWSMPNVIVTPHVGNTREMGLPLLAARVQENVRRFCASEELIGVVDVDAGY